MLTDSKKKLTLASVFFTFFVDNLSWTIVFPIFAPLFIDPDSKLFDPSVSFGFRTILLGIFLMSFPLAQFFGSPLLGEFADRNGRKKALLISIFFTLLGLAVSAWSISQQNLVVLFISRFATGLFSGNLSICMSAVADLSRDEKHKVKSFGYLAVIAGFAFIVGSFLGGKLSDPTLSSWFNFAFPLWVATSLAFLNLVFVFWGFRETFKVDKTVKFDLLEGVHNIQKALKIPRIKTLYLIYFCFLFGWNTLLQFVPVHLVKQFDFSSSDIGDVAAFMGICWAFGSGVVNKWLARWFCTMKILEVCLLITTGLFFWIAWIYRLNILLIIIGISVILAGVIWPICTAMISNLADKKVQGKILGISQSMQSLAMALSPVIGGFIEPVFLGAPFVLGAITSLIAALLYFQVRKADRNKKIG